MKFINSIFKKSSDSSDQYFSTHGFISTGGLKITGGHDHRTNRGDDRTPAQKSGDKKPKILKNDNK